MQAAQAPGRAADQSEETGESVGAPRKAEKGWADYREPGLESVPFGGTLSGARLSVATLRRTTTPNMRRANLPSGGGGDETDLPVWLQGKGCTSGSVAIDFPRLISAKA